MALIATSGPEDPILQARRAVAELAAEDRRDWSPAEQSGRVVGLIALEERVHAEMLRAVGNWDEAAAWAADGATGPTPWLASRTAIGRRAASLLVRTARFLRTRTGVATALAAGALTCVHAELMTRAARDREDLFDAHETTLVDAARTLDVESFATVAARWRALADDDLGRRDFATQHERRYLRISSTFGGRVVLDGELDPDAGAAVLAVFESLDKPDVANGALRARTRGQRYADLFVELVTRGGTPTSAPVGLDVLVDSVTLMGGDTTDAGTTRCEIATVGPIPRSTMRRLACDAAVGRIVRRGASEILDVGRRTRLVSRAQRRALIARDGGCVFPGCDRGPGWCDTHHLVHWVHGGTTDLDNLALLCRRHHVTCHEGGWKLQRAEDGAWRADPPASVVGSWRGS